MKPASEVISVRTRKTERVKIQEITELSVRDEINIPIEMRAAPSRSIPKRQLR